MRTYTTWLPLLITLFTLGVYVVLPVKPTLTGANGLASSLLTLVSTLPGFYLAGLAAVATFGSATMDQEMPAPAPEIKLRITGEYVVIKLTRRLFLSYLFSYLVFLSIFVCVATLACMTISPSLDILQNKITQWTGLGWPWMVLQGAASIVLIFAFASMMVSTLHGVFFLSEKIHQP